MDGFWQAYGEAAKTAAGFFWKAGWAFVLGYGVSAMIQAFVPKKRLTRVMGDPGPKSISLATIFGTISSSCSFAALATARSLVRKGAHFVAAVAFMFASTNLVIELGVLILRDPRERAAPRRRRAVRGGPHLLLQTLIAWTCLAVVAGGIVVHLVAQPSRNETPCRPAD